MERTGAPILQSSKQGTDGAKAWPQPVDPNMGNSLDGTHLGGHDQLVIHNVVGGVAHSKEGAGGV